MMSRYGKLLFLVVALAVSSCRKDAGTGSEGPVPGNPSAPAFYNLAVATDKACYHPGEEIKFTLNGLTTFPVRVRYKHLNTLIADNVLPSAGWTWTAPADDFRGYSVEVYDTVDHKEVIYGTTAVDVSSDWTKFPRYGFLSSYGVMSGEKIQQVIGELNRFHINGLQFYDWHNKHHKPLPMTGGAPASSWKDIGNRDTYFNTVKGYIDAAHSRNMKTMFYNLLYGAWDDAQDDGVDKQWYMYTDNTHTNIDIFALSSPFLSNLYLLDPSNPGWQQYLMAQNDIIYRYLGFDGYHIDQLGERGSRYTYNGSFLDLSQAFGSFIQANNNAFPDKYAVMNAVNQYGQQTIARSPVDFLYTEVWSPYDTYKDLASLIKQNNMLAGDDKNQVLAAYVNYNLANTREYFNDASVLYADAVIFAFGGAHLELGEHMLCREYFPFNKLKMSDNLKVSLIRYYDFMVAYQNLLRDGGDFNTIAIQSLDNKAKFANWPEGNGFVSVVGKQVGDRQIIHLINFTASTTTSWRDNDGIQTMPPLISGAKISFTHPDTVNRIWVASPDIAGGSPQ
ncbi:MAG TPA: glycoside hydrolase family 66 protein, partial [Bacteroidales bacterium]|nr:glycoside hydrolase family 66 protein [Bacteroidales bacterium]HPT03417.1 glycoside hydrolase family 66 protein [Bacteroidales bacterium]